MKIGIISDMHMVYNKYSDSSRIKNDALLSIIDEVDCLVMCGDNAEYNRDFANYRMLLENVRNRSGIPIALITGNHEIMGNLLRRGIAISEIEDKFAEYSVITNEYGVVHLDDNNLELEGLTICGTYGHYDGTLSGIVFQEDYDSVGHLVSRLLQRLHDSSKKKLLVTHSVPNKAMIGKEDGSVQDRYTPFAGSLQLERAIQRIEPNWHFCGHTHAPAQSRIGNTLSFNVGTDYHNFFYLIVDTSDDSVSRFEKNLNSY